MASVGDVEGGYCCDVVENWRGRKGGGRRDGREQAKSLRGERKREKEREWEVVNVLFSILEAFHMAD